MSRRPNPLANFKFTVNVTGHSNWAGIAAGFSRVRGLKATTEKITYREGNDLPTPRNVLGQTTFDDIVLERGLTTDMRLVEWYKAALDLTRGFVGQMPDAGAIETQPPAINPIESTVVINLHSKSGTIRKHWKVYSAQPIGLEFSDFESDGNAIVVEMLTFCHEGWQIGYSTITP